MKKVIFRADANPVIGYGHFIRTLALADMLKNEFSCYFYTVTPNQYQKEEIKKVCKYIELSDTNHFEEFLSCLDGTEIVVLDNYFFTVDYQKEIKSIGCKLVCIDDFNARDYFCDVLINFAPGASKKGFRIQPFTKVLGGIDYVLLRAPFLNHPSKTGKEEALFICLGGTDSNNYTMKIVESLTRREFGMNIHIVVGASYKFLKELRSFASYHTHIAIHSGINSDKLALLMQQCTYAIVSASTVLFEALATKLFVASGYYVDNQCGIYEGFKKLEIIVPMGSLGKINDFFPYIELLQQQKENLTMSLEHIDFSEIPSRYLELFRSL